jgi:hypothetical protein
MFNAWSVRLPSSGPCTGDHNLSGMASSLGCRPRPPTRTGLRTEGMPTYVEEELGQIGSQTSVHRDPSSRAHVSVIVHGPWILK